MKSPKVFISYSHDSVNHSENVLAFANRLVEDGINCVLDQYETSPSEGWPRWMEKQIHDADFVLMICTEIYLKRVLGKEIEGKGLGVKWEGNLIYQHIYESDIKNTRFIPILFKDSKIEYIPTPLRGSTYYLIDSNEDYEKLYRRLTDQPYTQKPKIGNIKKLSPRGYKPDPLNIQVSLAKLPSTSPDLFGREKELSLLDNAWNNPEINVVALVAWGGVGKTALINKWINRLGNEYGGAKRVFGWSFYSQGASEGRQTSADLFIAKGLEWFGDLDPTIGSPWDKGERLAKLIKQERTLLVLDGLEPLQNPPPGDTGRIKDPALLCLLRELARQNPGLVIITTRLDVDDIKEFLDYSMLKIDLENLTPEAGVAYLKHLGVKGKQEELLRASRDVGGHALALTLLGSYLKIVYHGDVRQRDKVSKLIDHNLQGAHARRIMKSYETWFAGTRELQILMLLGLFDRPVESSILHVLEASPTIRGITDIPYTSQNSTWQFALNNLKNARLVSIGDENDPNSLDCHPLVREYFGERFKETYPESWRIAHSRLYEYYKNCAKPNPETVEDMLPLYTAIRHACMADRHTEALVDVYWHKIQKGQEFYSKNKLGAFSSDLSALANYFTQPWEHPLVRLDERTKSFILNEVGSALQALGRMSEAIEPIMLSIEMNLARKDIKNVSLSAGNLSEIYTTIGNFHQAFQFAQQSIELADQSNVKSLMGMSRSKLGFCLHQAGKLHEAENIFHQAETIQKSQQNKISFLDSLPGFYYCELLLDIGNFSEAEQRATRMMKSAKQKDWPLELAIAELLLGQIQLFRKVHEKSEDLSQVQSWLEKSMESLRRAGTQYFLPLGLITRAQYYLMVNNPEKVQADLDEALFIATRSGMRLHEADCHLKYARLYCSKSEKEKFLDHFNKAKQIICDVGYHRRDKEVEILEKECQH